MPSDEGVQLSFCDMCAPDERPCDADVPPESHKGEIVYIVSTETHHSAHRCRAHIEVPGRPRNARYL